MRPRRGLRYIASAYAKTKRGEQQYINLINAGNLLYADKKRIADLELTGEVKSSFESATVGNPLDSVAYPGGGAQAESAAGRDSADAERHSIHVGWRSDFPKAVCMTTRASLMAKHGDDFRKAKAGDREAEARLVEAVSKPDKIKALVAAHPNASIVCLVHAEEATGRNKIPVMFAQYIASVTGIECDNRIVQTVRANHTGSNAAHRLFVSPEFDGEVKKGVEYIVVDDHITQGGTVNALRDHIESHGGKVVAVASLTLSQGSSTLAPTQETIDAVRRKHEGIDQTLKALGIADGVECLTQSECRYLASLSPDGLRDRIAASRPEGDGGLGEGAVREEVAPANERERHSLIVSVPTSGVRLRAKACDHGADRACDHRRRWGQTPTVWLICVRFGHVLDETAQI